jgi:hypothetical protein
VTDENVKRQISAMIEQAGDPQHRALLLVLLSIVDSLLENSKINAELVGQVAAIKNQMMTGTAKRNLAIRFMDKVMPAMLAIIWASIIWTWSSIVELQKFQTKIEVSQNFDKG